MLAIAEATLAAMTREHMLDRLRRFLIARSPDPGLQAMLASSSACRDLWCAWYDHFGPIDEHGLAVRLSYLLAAQVHRLDPNILQVAGGDAETTMKATLEERGILPFIAFDEG